MLSTTSLVGVDRRSVDHQRGNEPKPPTVVVSLCDKARRLLEHADSISGSAHALHGEFNADLRGTAADAPRPNDSLAVLGDLLSQVEDLLTGSRAKLSVTI